MSERGPIQLLLPFFSSVRAKLSIVATSCAAVAGLAAGGAIFMSGGFGAEIGVLRLGHSAVAEDPAHAADATAVSPESVFRTSEQERRAVAIGDSITVTSAGGERRRYRITGLKLLDGGCPASEDPHVAEIDERGELCWAADVSGTLRFVIEVETQAEPVHPAQHLTEQQKL